MTERLQVYKCEVCGNVVEMQHAGAGTLVCCGEPMKLYEANTADAAVEKHVPVLEEAEGGVMVSVGSVPHPMTEEHHIEWIELIADGVVHRAHLDPTGEPSASFCVQADTVTARESCNVHGVWAATA